MSNLNICTNLLLKRMTHCLLALLAMLMLNGCSSTGDGSGNSGRYAMQNDAPPDGDVNLDPNNIPDAVPVLEPRSAAGNKSPYTVLGETYEVMPESSGYTDTGKASWYGKKFHGYKTSNGEIFDMYKMSAAHRTLPIPSYVRVTNLANGRSGIVRVNDRGPFHSERIMDLSYAAAVKLDTPVHGGSTYLQAGAFRNQDSAMALRDKLVNLTGKPVNIDSLDGLFKVRIGPLADPNEVHNISELMLQNNFAKPQVVYF